MNDCFWEFICVCENAGCCKCKDYISVNCDLGNEMLKAYRRDIEIVREEWAKKRGMANA